MRFLTTFAIAGCVFLSACGNNTETEVSPPVGVEAVPETSAPDLATDGRLVISSLPKVSEPNACILPITVTNGTEVEATISMMQFTLSGPGEEDSGNMFGQTVAPGKTNTARLLFPTRQCDDLLEITAPSITCKTGETDCADKVEFEAGEALSFKRG